MSEEHTREDLFNTRVKAKKAQLKKIFKNISKNTKKLADILIERAAFDCILIEDMEEDISTGNLKEEMQQGKYTIQRANPLIAQRAGQQKVLNATIKQLTDLLPDEVAKEAGAALAAFVAGKK